MLTVANVTVTLAESTILQSVSFTLNAGQRAGLIGPNGAGKSTLLRVIAGDLRPDSGSVERSPGTTIGVLRQGFTDLQDGTLADLLDIPTRGLMRAQASLDRATAAWADPEADTAKVERAYDDALATFEASGGYAAIDELTALLDRFGLGTIPFDRDIATLSGGQKTRAGLAALLAQRPSLLLLDEPTNHLDVAAQEWLRDFLIDYRGAVLIVSHDRGFLDETVDRIFALDIETHGLTVYVGNYSDYVAARTHEEDEAEAAWQRQQKEVRRIEQDIRAMETKSRSIENSTIDFAVRKKAAKIVRPAVVRKAKLERMLESEDAAEKPSRRWGLAASFTGPGDGPRDIARLDHVSVAYGELLVLEDISLYLRHGDRVAIVGPNGAGKTTLLKLLTGEIVPTSGIVQLGAGVISGYFAQEQQSLDLTLTVLDQARRAAAMSESDLRTFLHRYLFAGDTVHRRIGALSYGARLMLALMALRGTHLLLLDEPLNHLDIDARENFERALMAFDGTIVFVGHDRYAIERIANRVFEVRSGSLREVDIEVTV
jgi:ATP-binding cassette subfamily F protein 3